LEVINKHLNSRFDFKKQKYIQKWAMSYKLWGLGYMYVWAVNYGVLGVYIECNDKIYCAPVS
jgi:hypothetical protein